MSSSSWTSIDEILKNNLTDQSNQMEIMGAISKLRESLSSLTRKRKRERQGYNPNHVTSTCFLTAETKCNECEWVATLDSTFEEITILSSLIKSLEAVMEAGPVEVLGMRDDVVDPSAILEEIAMLCKRVAALRFYSQKNYDMKYLGKKHAETRRGQATTVDNNPIQEHNAAPELLDRMTLLSLNNIGDSISDQLDDNNHTTEEEEELAEAFLDWALASKRAGNMLDCLFANLMRMSIRPIYLKMDAVRLLGLRHDDFIPMEAIPTWNVRQSHQDDDDFIVVEEISKRGLFETEGRIDTETCSKNSSFFRYRPSHAARDLGRTAQRIFTKHNYTLQNCRTFLVPVIEEMEGKIKEDRIFSANSFFNHRHDLYAASKQLSTKGGNNDKEGIVSGLEVLTRLFLFGLAIDYSTVEAVIGTNDLNTLFAAALLRRSPASSADLVAEVQIYPLSRSDLHWFCHANVDNCFVPSVDSGEKGWSDEIYKTYLFITDWPMESLRLPRDAVMPVGYDTLELLSLSAMGYKGKSGRLLDLCCGCGIQGIFAWCCANEDDNENSFSELVCVDINERACHFVVANIALNGIMSHGRSNEGGKDAYALCGDLYQPVSCCDSAAEVCGVSVRSRFRYIVSNPPFVAIPEPFTGIPSMAPARYAAGGVDGMALLKRIVQDCFKFLDFDEDASLLMVTEVPNVEESCELLQKCLPESERSVAKIRIAYVAKDVETVMDYAAIRECEAGEEILSRDWETSLVRAGVYNRALVLIAISRGKGPFLRTYKFGDDFVEQTHVKGDVADEEDAFLTGVGTTFARAALRDYKL